MYDVCVALHLACARYVFDILGRSMTPPRLDVVRACAFQSSRTCLHYVLARGCVVLEPPRCWRRLRGLVVLASALLISNRARVAATWLYLAPSRLTTAFPVRVGGCWWGWSGDSCGFCHFRGGAADAPHARTIATTRGIYSTFVSLDLSLYWARAGREGGSRETGGGAAFVPRRYRHTGIVKRSYRHTGIVTCGRRQ